METHIEATFLASLLFLNDLAAIDQAATLVKPEDFTDDAMRKLYRVLLGLREKGLPHDCSHTVPALEAQGMSNHDAVMAVSRAWDACPMEGYVATYAARITETARSRRLVTTISLASERLSGGEDLPWVKNELLADIHDIESDRQDDEDKSIGEIALPALNAMADRLSGNQSKLGLKTGLSDLDGITTGINPEEFWVCGAMPGRGKTAFGLQVALNLAGDGFPVYLLSLEMSRNAIFRRLLKMKYGAYAVDNPGKQWPQMLQYGADLKTLPLYVNDSSSLDIGDLTAKARLRIKRSGIRLVIVDYLQLVRGPGRDRRERVGDAAGALRRLAKDTGVPVLALSQLRRPEGLNERPSMLELKESGDIEAHAHVVLLMYMPTHEDGSFTGEEEIIIGKQREGPTGSVPIYFDGPKTLFRERTRIKA